VTEFPFVYLNHGVQRVETFGVAASIWIGFDEPLTTDRLQWMIDSCPEPIAGTFYADEALLYCESGSDFESALTRLYSDDDTMTPVVSVRFARALEAWACQVHDWTPIAFLIGPDIDPDISRRARRVAVSQWSVWSDGQWPEVIEWLEDYLDTFEDLPPNEHEAAVDEDWPAAPMNRLTLSFIVDRLPRPNAVDDAFGGDLADRVEDLRTRLEDY
jgi:hypothetical protein